MPLLWREKMRRRVFISFIGGAVLTGPFAARGQPHEQLRRIGVLIPLSESDAEAQIEIRAFRDGLRRLGWVANRNVEFVIRWAAGDVRLIQYYAKELVGLQPDAILARTTPVTAALLHETRSIPIVFVGPSDPVGAGFVASMARPGGNATGFTNVEASLGGKWVEVLKEINPHIARIAVIYDPKTSPGGGSFYLRLVEDAAKSITAEAIPLQIHDADEISRAIQKFARDPNGGLLVQPDVTTHNNRALIISTAERYRLPAVYAYPYYVDEGGLAAYGVDVVDLYRRAATYVDRILRGEKPDQLAVQAPAKFQLAINLKTAKALDLIVPLTLLARADELVE